MEGDWKILDGVVVEDIYYVGTTHVEAFGATFFFNFLMVQPEQKNVS